MKINISASVYVGEVVVSKYRGMFGSFLAFALAIGLQYVVAAGELTPSWRITSVACMVPVVLGNVEGTAEVPSSELLKINFLKNIVKDLRYFWIAQTFRQVQLYYIQNSETDKF